MTGEGSASGSHRSSEPGDLWDPRRYLRHGAHRHRAAADLLARIHCDNPEKVHDVGCGTGALARLMAQRWPGAEVTGSDASAAMLAEAAATPSSVEWRRLDVRRWPADERTDVLTANAVLHWVPDHDELIARLFASVRPGGALAIQMPQSWHEPIHAAVRDVLRRCDLGSAELWSRLAEPPVADPGHYHALLSGLGARVDIWSTRYLHALTGPDAVLGWLMGTTLPPVLEDLGDAAAGFLAELAPVLRDAYPMRKDPTRADPMGRNTVTLLPFPRLFIVAHR